MNKALFAFVTAAVAVSMVACHTNPTVAVPSNPSTPSALTISLDVMAVSAAAAAPYFAGPAGAWLAEIEPTSVEIATDLQGPNPFVKAAAVVQTLDAVVASAPAEATLTADQKKVTESVLGATSAFLALYEAQAGIGSGTAVAAAQVRFQPNAADMKTLNGIAKRK